MTFCWEIKIYVGYWLVSKELFRSERYEGLSELAVHLSSEWVEVVRWERAVHDRPVNLTALSSESRTRVGDRLLQIVIALLKISLHASWWVFRSLTIHAMREQQDETSLNVPLRFTTGQIVIDNDLCTIGEITKLSFPNCETVRVRDGISVFETKNTIFW